MLKGLKNKKKLPKPMSVKEFDKLTLGGFHTEPYQHGVTILGKGDDIEAIISQMVKNFSEVSIIFSGIDEIEKQFPSNNNTRKQIAIWLYNLINATPVK